MKLKDNINFSKNNKRYFTSKYEDVLCDITHLLKKNICSLTDFDLRNEFNNFNIDPCIKGKKRPEHFALMKKFSSYFLLFDTSINTIFFNIKLSFNKIF